MITITPTSTTEKSNGRNGITWNNNMLKDKKWLSKRKDMAILNRSKLTKYIDNKINKMKQEDLRKRIILFKNKADKNKKCLFNKINSNNNIEFTNHLIINNKGVNTVIDDPKQMLHKMNKYWTELYKATAAKISLIPTSFSKYVNKPNKKETKYLREDICTKEIEAAIINSKNHHAPGTSGIGNEIYKYLCKDNIESICRLLNQIKSTNHSPICWKAAEMILIPKTSQTYKIDQYRPISLLNSLYKIYTNILKTRLNKILESRNILSDCQFGFRKGRTPGMAHKLLNNVIEHAEKNKKELYILYIDFKKAFDLIQHWAIKNALKHYKLDDSFINNIMALYKNIENKVNTPWEISLSN